MRLIICLSFVKLMIASLIFRQVACQVVDGDPGRRYPMSPSSNDANYPTGSIDIKFSYARFLCMINVYTRIFSFSQAINPRAWPVSFVI
jgi:hypothetical protein